MTSAFCSFGDVPIDLLSLMAIGHFLGRQFRDAIHLCSRAQPVRYSSPSSRKVPLSPLYVLERRKGKISHLNECLSAYSGMLRIVSFLLS